MRPLSASQDYAWRHTPARCRPRAPELLYAALLAPRKHHILCHFYMLYLGPTWVRYMDAFINIITIMRTTCQIMQIPPPIPVAGGGRVLVYPDTRTASKNSLCETKKAPARVRNRGYQIAHAQAYPPHLCRASESPHRLYFFFFLPKNDPAGPSHI